MFWTMPCRTRAMARELNLKFNWVCFSFYVRYVFDSLPNCELIEASNQYLIGESIKRNTCTWVVENESKSHVYGQRTNYVYHLQWHDSELMSVVQILKLLICTQPSCQYECNNKNNTSSRLRWTLSIFCVAFFDAVTKLSSSCCIVKK